MAFTADAWVGSNGSATITLWNSDGWTNGSWRISGSVNNFFPDESYTRLYSLWKQSGVGVINGDSLTIFIETVPEGLFSLETERGTKNFVLSEGEISFGAALVGANNIRLDTYEGVDRYLDNPKKTLIYFGGDLEPFRGRLSAQLQIDGKLHATVAGNAVDYITGELASDGEWHIPAAAFMDFYWVTTPSKPTVYDFVFKEEKRNGDGVIMSFKVEMDLNRIYSPLATKAYPVSTKDWFFISLSQGLEVRE